MTDLVCAFLDDDYDAHILHHLHRLETMMTEFANDQAHLDADVQALTAGLTVVEQEIAALKSQPAAQALDFTALDAAVARVQADAPAPPAHVPPADTLYQHEGANPIDPALWVQSATTAADGSPLYTYTGTSPFDTAEWVVYVPPVDAPPAPVADPTPVTVDPTVTPPAE